MAWPPTLTADLKVDLGLTEADDTADDAALGAELAAAVEFVERTHAGRYDFTGALPLLPAPGPTIELGTVRLAGRWFTRRRSPDGMISAGELGVSRVGSGDSDIDRMLRIGRFAPPVIS